MLLMCLTCSGPLNTSLGSLPAKPFSLVANGTLCQAEKLSNCTHDCHPVVNPQAAAPAALIFAAAAITSGQVAGARFGSRPAFSKTSWL